MLKHSVPLAQALTETVLRLKAPSNALKLVTIQYCTVLIKKFLQSVSRTSPTRTTTTIFKLLDRDARGEKCCRTELVEITLEVHPRSLIRLAMLTANSLQGAI